MVGQLVSRPAALAELDELARANESSEDGPCLDAVETRSFSDRSVRDRAMLCHFQHHGFQVLA